MTPGSPGYLALRMGPRTREPSGNFETKYIVCLASECFFFSAPSLLLVPGGLALRMIPTARTAANCHPMDLASCLFILELVGQVSLELKKMSRVVIYNSGERRVKKGA